jgi:ATP/maltotriose-dependent transcriptional regulator MalT
MRQSQGFAASAGVRWPLICRREELTAVERSLTSPGSRTVVLAGAPGVGKTRLAMEARALCQARGYVVRWAAATQAASSLPFGAIAHLLPRLGDAAPDRAELLQRAADGLVAEAGDRRLLVVIDDAHLLDDSSAALVHQLATATPVTVLVTMRSETQAPDPIVALWKDAVAERFEIQALSRDEVATLVAAVLGGQVDGSTVHSLWRLAQGNPLYLRELVLGGLDSGSLACVAGVWRWDGAVVTSPRLVELIGARLGRLDAEVVELLEVLALAEPVSVQLLERLVKPEILAAADRKGLLVTDEAGRRVQARLAHPLYAEVIGARVSRLRARAIYRQLTAAVEAASAPGVDDRLRVATWRLEAEAGGSAPGQLMSAAELAMDIFDFALAERLARAAAAAGGEVEAERLVGLALIAQGRPDDAELVLGSLTPGAGTDQERVQVAVTRAFNLYWALDLPAQAKAVLQHAEQVLTSRGARAEVAAVLAGLLLFGGDVTQALQALEPILGDADADDRSTVQAMVAAVPALYHAGRCEQAITAAARSFESEQRLSEEVVPFGHLQIAVNLGNAYLAAGRLEEADTLAAEGYRHAIEHAGPYPVAKALWACSLGQIARARGQVRTALRWQREAATAATAEVPLPFMPQILGELAHAAALAGDLAAADAALAASEEYTAEGTRLFHLWAALARPWEAAARGEQSTAIRLATELAEQAQARGQVTFQLQALHDVARLGEANRVVSRLREAAAGVEGQLAPLYVSHAAALDAYDGLALDQIASSFAGLGFNLLAAEAASEAVRAHQADGRRTAAAAAATLATTLAAQCEGARTAALDLLQPGDLTPRELEIATMAAHGLSSKAIAERLVVSVRTVDNTLHQVYAKLAVSNRAALRPLLIGPESLTHRAQTPSQ